MKKVLIYAGTTEGRELAMKLADERICSIVCVATEYGQQVMLEEAARAEIMVRQGRLSAEEMRELLRAEEPLAVVDATHPYAAEVTKNIRKSVEGEAVPYFRIQRNLEEAPTLMENCLFFDSADECARKLCEGKGNILLTTGSKELEAFCQYDELKKRLVVRVLPGRESMELCWKNGLEGKQIIAMQGPFTKEMNLATIRQYAIEYMVTKESGKVGGADEKLEAAKEAGISCYVLRRPVAGEEKSFTFTEVFEAVRALAKDAKKPGSEKAFLDVVLAGIGMGAANERSVALEQRLAVTDHLFGAKRMLEGLSGRKGTFPFYLEKDILPCLKSIQEKESGRQTVTILFSGDVGFYSGAAKLSTALYAMENLKVTFLPGTSSVSALAAGFGVSWQDSMILSTHGVKKECWKAELLFGLRRERKLFFITSGPEDVREIALFVIERGFEARYRMKLGYQISYPEGKLLELTMEEAAKICEPGLYAGFLIIADENTAWKSRHCAEAGVRSVDVAWITPGFPDDAFLRGKVPMTKEEVREISLCKLRLTERAVAYDVGSGTGSIAMEMAALSPQIQVYAIECDPEAAELIQRNRERFGASRVQLIETKAPEGMDDIPAPTHVFIGGSRGNLREIMEAIYHKNPRARIVMNAISLESIAQMQELVKVFPVEDLEITTVSVSKAKQAGSYHLMQAANPVTIFSFTFRQA